MAIIRQKKKNLILAMVLGIVIVAVPLGIYSSILTNKAIKLDRRLEELQQQMEQEKTYTAYCFKETKGKGERISAEDLEEVSFKSKENLKVPGVSDLEGKCVAVETQAGIIITDSILYEDVGLGDDVRTYLYDYIILPQGINSDDMFDIRIRFPNGEDYVIAVGKKIQSVVEGGAFIDASEKENLLLSSAYVDTTVYAGAKIYAALYVADYQEASVANYPFNLYTTELASWNPNLIEEMETETNRQNRQMLETNLYDFMGVAMGGETIIDT